MSEQDDKKGGGSAGQLNREEKSRLLSIAVEQSAEGVAVVDLEGNILFVNEAFAAMHGYASGELDGKNLSIFHTHEQMPAVDEANRRIRETGMFNGEIWHVRRDGTVFPALMQNALLRDESGRPTFMLGTLLDISDRKRAEEALQRSEKRFRDIAENAREWIWEVDLEGRYTYSSAAVETLLGYRPEEMLEKHFYDFFLPEEKEALKKAAFAVFSKKETFREFVNRNRHKDGQTVWLTTSGVPILDVGGNLLGYRGADTDITQRKEAEDSLRQSEEQLRLSLETTRRANEELLVANERLKEIDRIKRDFLASVSHELRTPLAVIAGAVENLGSGKARGRDENEEWLIKIIDRNAARLGRLIDNLLEQSRIETGHFTLQKERIDLCKAVLNSVDNMRGLAEKNGLDLAVALPDRPLTAMVDHDRIAQIVTNLLDNAFRFAKKEVRVRCEEAGAFARIVVEDEEGMSCLPIKRKKSLPPKAPSSSMSRMKRI